MYIYIIHTKSVFQQMCMFFLYSCGSLGQNNPNQYVPIKRNRLYYITKYLYIIMYLHFYCGNTDDLFYYSL